MIILENRPKFLKSDEDILSWINLDEAERKRIISIYKEKQIDTDSNNHEDSMTYSQLRKISEMGAFI